MPGSCELVLDAHAIIGESPSWSASDENLYWIDVKAPALFALHPPSGRQRRWDFAADIGAFALCADGKALLALRDGLFELDLQSGVQTAIAPPPFDASLFRFNEGACDRVGRFWIGVMFDPISGIEQPKQPGSLHVYTKSAGLLAAPDAASLHNGMAWSHDENSFFLSHSDQQTIYRYAYDAEAGRIGARSVFATVPAEDGIPDGAAVDAEGGYWCALHGGWALRRFHADGTHDRDVRVPVSQPTMCAFAGPGLKELYITTASDKLDAAALQRQRYAGGLFKFEADIPGAERAITVR